MAEPVQNLAPGAPTSPPVAGNGASKPVAAPAPAPSAAQSAPRFGGLRGGRARQDGLVPGSPEADKADKAKDAQRKRAARARQADPAPLPSAGPGLGSPAQAPPGAVGPVPGPGGLPPIPWDPDALKPLFEQLLPTVEQMTVNKVSGLAVEAKLPPNLVAEIRKDAHWPVPAKKAVEVAAPRVTAKWLNRSGISSEHQDELILGTALAAIVASHTMLVKKLQDWIARREADKAKTVTPQADNGEKKGPAEASPLPVPAS